ncbi:LysM peptidoglycan-binding domain-containing M23 family metallopeptidase [Thiomicrospira sp.]|uniref:LysM peptidoglycan-binding domain-containing M23 family metallopeptidase n=1 Tax=Thiomicrospira sp. TaxID=935 RepID=UPI002F93F5BD
MFRVLLIALISISLFGCGQTPRSYLQADQSYQSNPLNQNAGKCKSGHYVVAKGDTLSQVAVRCQVSFNALAKKNSIFPPYVLYPGQELSLPDKAAKPSVTVQKPDWLWPVEHFDKFDYVKDSAGITGLNIYSETGSLVKTVDAGEVVFADNSVSNFGLMVIIRHENGYLTVYAHNQRLQVKEGQIVKRGEVIANLGRSGSTDLPKLYFEARLHGRKVAAEGLLKQP